MAHIIQTIGINPLSFHNLPLLDQFLNNNKFPISSLNINKNQSKNKAWINNPLEKGQTMVMGIIHIIVVVMDKDIILQEMVIPPGEVYNYLEVSEEDQNE